MKTLFTLLMAISLLPTLASAQLNTKQGGTGRASFTGGDFIFANSDPFQRLTGTSSPFFTNFTFTNATGTSATTTNFFSTTASSTNLFSSLLTVGGTGLVVDSSRNVGIGTSTPQSKLHSVGTGGTWLGVSRTGLFENEADAGSMVEFKGTTGSAAFGISGTSVLLGSGTAASDMRFYTANSNRMTLTAAGNLGLGTTTPFAYGGFAPNLSLEGAAPSIILADSGVGGDDFQIGVTGDDLYFLEAGVGTRMLIDQDGLVGIASTTPFAQLAVENIGSGLSFAVNDQAADASPFIIDASGNVGIGSASITRKLNVVTPNGTNEALRLSQSAIGSWDIGVNSNDSFAIWDQSIATPYFTVATGGNVGIGTTTPWGKLSVAGSAGGTAPLFTVSSSTAAFATTTVFHIGSNGNVGIGTVSPTARLEVGGSITLSAGNATYGITLPERGQRITIGTYGTISETLSGAAYITGNNVAASRTTGNTLVKSASSADGAQYFGQRYDRGIWFGTGIGAGDAVGTAYADATNTRFSLGLTGNVGVGGNITSLSAMTGASMAIISGNVGIATTTPQVSLSVAGLSEVRLGTSTSTARVGGSIFATSTDAGNQTTVETDIFTRTIKGDTLSVDNDSIEAKYTGTFVGSGTATRQVRAYFGGTLCFDTGAVSIASNSAWVLFVDVQRVSATVVRCSATLNTQGASLSAYTGYVEITGLSLAANNIFKVTGTATGVGAATNDIVAKMGKIKWFPASN